MDEFFVELERYLGTLNNGNGKEIIKICDKYAGELEKEGFLYYYKGYGYFLEGYYKKAKESLDRSIEIEANDDMSYSLRGDVLKALGNIEYAILDYNKSIEINGDNWRGNYGIGLIYYYDTDYEKAYEHFVIADKELPNMKEILTYIGSSLYYLGRYDEYKIFMDKIIETTEKNAQDYSNRALANRILEDFDKAEEDLKAAIKLEPNTMGYYSYLIDLYLDIGDYSEAEEIGRIISARFDNEEVYKILGKIYHIKEDYSKSLYYLEKGLSIKEDVYFRLNKILTLELLERYEDALEELKYIEDTLEIQEEYLYHKGKSNFHLGNIMEALECFKRMDENQSSTEVMYYLGLSYYSLEDFDKGFEYLKEYDESVNCDYYIKKILGECAKKLGDFESSLKYLNIALEDENLKAEVYYRIGSTYLSLNNKDKALEHFELSIENETDRVSLPYKAAGKIYLDKDEIEKAKIYLEDSICIYDEDLEALYYLGIVYDILEEKKLSFNILERYVEIANGIDGYVFEEFEFDFIIKILEKNESLSYKNIEIINLLKDSLKYQWKYLYFLGLCENEQGNYERALEYLKEANKIEENDFQIIMKLAGNFSIINREKEAIKLLKKYIKANEESYKAYILLGLCYLKLEKYKKVTKYAKIAIDKAKEINIEDGDAYYLMAQGCHAGRTREELTDTQCRLVLEYTLLSNKFGSTIGNQEEIKNVLKQIENNKCE